ncbi:ABC transporter permease [Salirhabdus sp. Marseille-P4669]|uniref:ABC transporter permease n=1 Tax=Salirhabdus sp. Marseille-P4669 TaxID=2042310 RepID=UPI000C7E791D|nr:ABC transporter permease [Salirhabdus sp. Marseille-P4669]
MFNASTLWKERLSNHFKETSRYMRLIFNDHLAIALFFLLAAFAYFYQQWLKTIPQSFPADWIIAILLGALLTRSPIRTLLKEPDTVFLLPTEHKMDRYFSKAFWYSLIIQVYQLALGFGILLPLYFTAYPERPRVGLLLFLIILLVFKLWNMLSTWWLLKERDAKTRYMDTGLRLLLNVLTLFFFLQEDGFLYASITSIIFVALLLYHYNHVGKKGIAWDVLIEKEQAMLQSFYRLANLFTDVPNVKKKSKKRHTLVSFLTSKTPFNQTSTFAYLYRITFVRSSDYFGLYIRLIIVAIFLIFWVPNVWFKMVFAILFIYLSGFQLMTLWNHHRTLIWIDIYPVSKEVRKKSLLQFLLLLMLFQTAILGLFMLVASSWEYMLLLWGAGGLFSFVFINSYVKNRLEKRKVTY